MNNIVLGVTYKGAERYLDDYLSSLANQNNKDFLLLLINDGVSNLSKYLKKYGIESKVVNMNTKKTPAEIREIALKECKKLSARNVIFTDCDDFYSKNRVKESIRALAKNKIVFNNLVVVDKNGKFIDNYFKNKSINYKKGINDILDRNYYGMSNMAIEAKLIDSVLPIPKDIIAVDWWIVSNVLLKVKSAGFIKDVYSYYRQHNNNTIGSSSISKDKVLRGVDVKLKHYKYLSKRNKELFKERYLKIVKLKDNLKKDKDIKLYLKYLRNIYNKRKYFWWEYIVPIEMS